MKLGYPGGYSHAFTLAELLIAISIVAMITTISVSVYVEGVKKARDAQRLADIAEIQTALEAYKADHGYYPGYVGEDFGTVYGGETSDCNDWDTSYDGLFIPPLVTEGYLSKQYMDPLNDRATRSDPVNSSTACAGIQNPGYNYYYRLWDADATAAVTRCPVEYGDFYVLGIGNLETVNTPENPNNPGFRCNPSDPTAETWIGEKTGQFEYSVGKFSGVDRKDYP